MKVEMQGVQYVISSSSMARPHPPVLFLKVRLRSSLAVRCCGLRMTEMRWWPWIVLSLLLLPRVAPLPPACAEACWSVSVRGVRSALPGSLWKKPRCCVGLSSFLPLLGVASSPWPPGVKPTRRPPRVLG